ncbi:MULTISPECIES: DUF3515 family protein [Microbacterium]|uniref:DUF3515 family protein n=1 Tax=Microbacterium saccharophilum TaxID=1213358 RepID=A0A7Z7D034_9MICO|nr:MULTISPECIES: DUF3515 family protein [Microbacterium]SFI28110.1 Protein of unknown function [Microbacterium saccharophilum]
MPRPRPTAVLLAVLTALTLTGCATTVSMQPADDANDPLCAEVMVRLPDTLDGQQRLWTDAQSTAAWGDPSAVLVSCGVVPPGPTEAQCITVAGIDWIVDDSAAPRYRITSYGRTPAVEVLTDNEIVAPTTVLDGLATALQQVPAQRQCTSTSSVLP